jgi:hypothetical protein
MTEHDIVVRNGTLVDGNGVRVIGNDRELGAAPGRLLRHGQG